MLDKLSPLQSLLYHVPEGLVVTRKRLYEWGFTKPSIDSFLRSKRLEAVSHGVYRRPGPQLKWKHVVFSLNELGYDVHVGGISALIDEWYLPKPTDGEKEIHLYSLQALPKWVNQVCVDKKIVTKRVRFLNELPEGSLFEIYFGHWDWVISYAKPILALFEALDQVKTEADFFVLDRCFRSLVTLWPDTLNSLLRECKKIVTVRLFLWFADRHNHRWRDALDLSGVNLGSGKRMIIQGGSLDPTYHITVPKEMAHGNT
jgi:hypothetical protein